MADMPSFITTSECTNNFCSNQRYDYNSIKLSVNKYNEEYSIQNDWMITLKTMKKNVHTVDV